MSRCLQLVEIALIDPDLAAGGPFQQADQLQQGALAGAGMTGEKGHLSGLDAEADPGQALVAAGVALADVVEVDHETRHAT